MIFVGTHAHTIDNKNRVAIPATIRGQIQRDAGTGEGDAVYLYVTLGEEGSLAVYTEKEFEDLARQLRQTMRDPVQQLRYERLLFSTAERVEMDKQGRVRLPDHLLKRQGLGTEVVLLGVGDHLEIRNREWLATLKQDQDDNQAMFVNPRQFLQGSTHTADEKRG